MGSAAASGLLDLLQQASVDLEPVFASCLSCIQASKDLTGDLSSLSSDQAISVSNQLRQQWSQPGSHLVLPALQVAGYLLAVTTFTNKLADGAEEQLLKSLAALLHAITRKDEARVAYWCLSRQTLQPRVLQQHRADLVTAIALGLVSSNKWNSMQCVFHSLRCIARLAQQVPEALRECAPLWLPQLWRLLLVQPVTDYEQKANVRHSFGKLRSEALLTFNQAWSQQGGRPCTGDLPSMLIADLTGSKPAAHPADSDGLLNLMWSWTQPCRASPAKSGTLDSKVALKTPSGPALELAMAAVHAWGCYTELLGETFLTRDPPVGQPMLKLVERTFTFLGDPGLPKATFTAWQKLADILSACGQIHRRHHLLLNPVTHALKTDKRREVHEAAFAAWQFMVQLAVRAPTSGSPASSAAKHTLFLGVVGPVLHILIHALPAADAKQGGQTSSLWPQALGWLAAMLVDKQLLVALLDVLSTLLPAAPAQQAQQQVAVHTGATLHLHVWTALLLKTLDTFKDSPEADAQLVEKALLLVSHIYHGLCQIHSDRTKKLDSKTWADSCTGLRECLAEACAAAACRQNSSASKQEVSAWLACAEAMLDSFSAFSQHLPASARSAVPASGKNTTMPLHVMLFDEWSKLCSVLQAEQNAKAFEKLADLLLVAEKHTEPVKQLQLHWQHCSLSTNLDASSGRHLPSQLCIWGLLAGSLAHVLPTSDEFDQSDAAMMTAVAFITEVLKHPFELLERSRTAGRTWVVSACPDHELEMQANQVQKDTAVCKVTVSTAASYGKYWSNLYQAMLEMVSHKPRYRANCVDLLHSYLVNLAPQINQAIVEARQAPDAVPSLSAVWLCAAAVSLVQQAVAHGTSVAAVQATGGQKASGEGARGTKPANSLLPACQLLSSCLEGICHAAVACPDAAVPSVCGLLSVVPSMCTQTHALMELQQQLPLKALGLCMQLPNEVAGQHAELPALLKAAWASLLKAINVEAFAGLSQSCVCSVLLQPLAAALRNRSAALRDPAEEFWSSSGIQDALQGCDLGLVEAALAESASQLSHLGGQSGFKLDQQVLLEQPFGRARAQSPFPAPQQSHPSSTPGPVGVPPATAAQAQASHTRLVPFTPAAAVSKHAADDQGPASKKRPSRSPFDESQTEYVKIASAVKRPCVLTDRQKEVLARQKAGAGREGIVTYTGLDASQHTQHPGSAPSLDLTHKPSSNMPASNEEPPQAAANLLGQAASKEPSIPGTGHKQKSQAQASIPKEPNAPVKEDAGPSMDMPTKTMGCATGAAKGRGLEHGRTLSKQLGQTTAQDRTGVMDAQLPVKQQQSSPIDNGRQQQAGSKAAAQAAGVGLSAGQAAKVSHARGPNHAHEGRPPFGLFPSTQQSSSQPSSKLPTPAGQRTHAAVTATQQQPPKTAQQHQQQQQQQPPQQQQQPPQQQQQGRLRQGQQQTRQPPSMSPSESSSVRPPQRASRRMSTDRAIPAAELEGLAAVSKQQPQLGTDEQGSVAKGVREKEKMAAAAAKGSTKMLSADAGWKPRRGRKPSPPAADSPALAVQGGIAADSPALEVQAGTAPECRTNGLEDKDASTPDQQLQAQGQEVEAASHLVETEADAREDGASPEGQCTSIVGKHPGRSHGGQIQKKDSGHPEGSAQGSGGKPGGWAGRLKSLFTISGRESPTKPVHSGGAVPAAVRPTAASTVTCQPPPVAQAAAVDSSRPVTNPQGKATTDSQWAGKTGLERGREGSPEEAAVSNAFAIAGALAHDLVPDSAEQDEHTNSKGGHTTQTPTVKNPDNSMQEPALLRPVTGTAAEVKTEAAKTSSATPTQAKAAKATATSVDESAQRPTEANTALANTHKPARPATAAGSEASQTAVARQAAEKLMSQSTPLMLKQEDGSTIADSPHEDAGEDLPGMTEAHEAACGANPAGQEAQQMMMIEATEAADQLPMSYPATLVATLPCTVPAWLAQSQRTTATAVAATQVAPTQVVQALVARLPATSAHTAVLTKRLMPSMSTGRARPHGALQDRPQTKVVSRLSQLGDSAPEGMPDQAALQGATALCRDADRHSRASMPGPATAAVQHLGHAELNVKAAENSSAAKCPAALPDEARAAGGSPMKQATERGKRAAERSPGAYDMAKVTHKRARSDSPTAKPDWLQVGAQRKGPSDADVQELEIYATQQATSSPQQHRSPLHACYNVTTSQHHPAHSTSDLCKVPSQAAQHPQQPPADMHPSHSFEYDLPIQGQGTQDKGSQQQQQQQPPVLAKQESVSEAAPARYGVRLVDQHAQPRNGLDPWQQSTSQACQAHRAGTPMNYQQPTHQHEQQQQQQQLVAWGALGTANAAQAHAGAEVGQTSSSGSEGLMRALQQLHHQPPWDGLTVIELVQAQELLSNLQLRANAALQQQLKHVRPSRPQQ